MATSRPQTNGVALFSTLAWLLDNISEKGYWTDFQESWEPILTCVAVDVLMDAGLTAEHSWVCQRSAQRRIVLAAPFAWLNSRIQADGRFGTDFWDACRLASTIEKHGLHSSFPNYGELQKQILNVVSTNAFNVDQSDWIGPGFVAAAADYLDCISKHAEADALVARLHEMQAAEGRWCGPLALDGHPTVPAVWHTSQVVLTLMRKGAPEHGEAIKRGLAWIASTQDPTGRWPGTQQFVIYSTCYAILALNQAEAPDRAAITRGVDYLKSAMKPDGRIYDLGGTLMAAIALLAVTGGHVESDLSTIDYVLARLSGARVQAAESVAAAATSEAAVLKARNTELEKKYHNAEFALTKKQLLIIGPLFALLMGSASAVVQRLCVVWWPVPSSPAAPSKQEPALQTPGAVATPSGNGTPPPTAAPAAAPSGSGTPFPTPAPAAEPTGLKTPPIMPAHSTPLKKP